MNREEKILEFIKNKQYVPMKLREIAEFFEVPKDEISKLKEVLEKLEQNFKITRNKKNRYIPIEEKYIEGIYKANQKGFGFVEINTSEEIYIPQQYTNNALNGDKVLIQIMEEQQNKNKEAKIVKITKREIKKVVGIFKNSKNFGFVIPDDKKILTDIFISKKNFFNAKDNQKVVVELIKYPQKEKNAEGKIIEILGDKDQIGVDMLSLIKQYDLPYEFPKFVLEETKQIKNEIQKRDIPNRVDLRGKTIFTIDGEDAKDLDDAVCVERMQNGNYKLGVHIADVSYYVKEDTNIDKEAFRRGTSIYMLDRVIPMLPKKLSNGVCSLNAGEDRFTLSIEMEIDNKGNVISSEIYKGIINVTERMTYENVNKILENLDSKVISKYKKYISQFKQMGELARILEQRRKNEGTLDLDIPETKIKLDKDGKVVEIGKYELTFANTLIEQFMLIANETIAEKFYWLEAPFIYRVHEPPDLEKIQELNKFLYGFGYRIKGNKENIYPKEFAKILEQIKEKPEEIVISTLILRALKVARYESENKGHFGLASKYYCHFTSPIRRYPDLFIHRIISKYLEKNYNIKEEVKQDYIKLANKVAQQSSEREKLATKAQRDSIELKKAEFMQDKIGEIYNGIISSVTAFGIFVELENTIEGLIRFEDLGEKEYFIYDDEHKILVGENSKKTYRIGDTIKVQVIHADKETRKVAFAKVKE